MTNYKGSPTVDFALVTDHTNAAQNTFVGQLDRHVRRPAARDHPVRLRLLRPRVVEHAGLRRVLPARGAARQPNPFIHTANDTLAQSGNNANHALKYSKLAARLPGRAGEGRFRRRRQPPADRERRRRPVGAGGGPVTLAGSGSDPDGGPGPLTYAWSQVAGPSVTIANPSQATASVTPATAGAYTFRLTVGDGAASASDDVAVTVSSPGGTAVFDAALQAPKCAVVGSSCDTGAALVLGRDGRGPEPNQPNTINDACADGTSGTFHVDESNDRVRVLTTDGDELRARQDRAHRGDGLGLDDSAADSADFFYAADATNPVWTLVGTVHRRPPARRRCPRRTRCPRARCRPCACSTATRAARPPARPAGTTTATTSRSPSPARPSPPCTPTTSRRRPAGRANPNGTDTATTGRVGAGRSRGDDRQRRQAARHDGQRRQRPRDRSPGRRQRRDERRRRRRHHHPVAGDHAAVDGHADAVVPVLPGPRVELVERRLLPGLRGGATTRRRSSSRWARPATATVPGRRPPPTSARSPARPCASGSRPPTPPRPAWSRPAVDDVRITQQ